MGLKAFLAGRRHRVSVVGEWVYAKSGIPQGSVLGPMLFVIIINDLPFAIKNFCKLFADDTKLYRTIRTEDDTTSLKDDINRLVNWSTMWQLPFIEQKCKCMHIDNDKTSLSYQMNDHILENVKEIKDLGVITDHKLKFHNHSSAAVKKANFVLGLIKRSFVALVKSILPKFYMSMVRPHLEYDVIGVLILKVICPW